MTQYNFWFYKTRARITDPAKRDILCPVQQPHPWGTKRPSLEQDFYEQMDKPHVTLIDINKNPVAEVVPEGIVTEDGKLHELDILALATGFDSVTGGMKNMGLKDVNGVDLSDKWKEGTWSYLGLTCAGYPNMFFLYGAQGPTAFTNGPTCVEVQGGWIFDAIKAMHEQKVKSIDATHDAEVSWHKLIKDLGEDSLFPQANSWYMGANIPGKPREQLNFTGGLGLYRKQIGQALDGWKGFDVVKA